MIEIQDKMLPTLDDWYPNYIRDCVKCSLQELILLPPGKHSTRAAKEHYRNFKLRFRVCIWGNDDTGMEQDFEQFSDAETMYKRLPNPITKEWLADNGFGPA